MTRLPPPHRSRLRLLVLVLFSGGCSDYALSKEETSSQGGDDSGTVAGALQITPAAHVFDALLVGQQDTVDITLTNIGEGALTIKALDYTSSGELSLQGVDTPALPWTLAPGASTQVQVTYSPTDAGTDEGSLTVQSDDPAAASALATQQGSATLPPQTQCYILDDGVAYETTSSSQYVVDHHGDTDLYWYEPSGYHGLLDSADPLADFAGMRAYITDQVGPTTITWPVSFDTDSTLSTFAYATFTYILCDFWVPAEDDPAAYALSIGQVDDGVQVIFNAEILGYLKLTESGSWSLPQTVPGEINHLLVTLVDDSASDRYMTDLWLTRSGKPVE